MNLTSLRRVKYALGVNTTAQDHILSRLVGSASAQVPQWLRRKGQTGGEALQLLSRTEYLDPQPGRNIFYPRAYPIVSITSIHADWSGQYTGAESLIQSTNYRIGSDGRSIAFTYTPDLPEGLGFPTIPKGMRLIYTAGLAADPVISSWTKSAGSPGEMAAGNYILGQSSGSVGYLTAAAAGALSYECLAGVFTAGETITEYAGWDFSLDKSQPRSPTGNTATLTACTSPSLAETHPALVEGVEMHIRYLRTNRDNFENLNVVQDGVTRFSRSDLKNRYQALPEVLEMLEPYRNKLMVS